jgi:hypothetical protein
MTTYEEQDKATFRTHALTVSRAAGALLTKEGVDEPLLRHALCVVEDAVHGRKVRFSSVCFALGRFTSELTNDRPLKAMLSVLRAAESLALDGYTTDAWPFLEDAAHLCGLPLRPKSV